MGNVSYKAGMGKLRQDKQLIHCWGIPNRFPVPPSIKFVLQEWKLWCKGAQAIALGDADIVVAGGMENMSLIPHYVLHEKWTKFGPSTLIDGMQKERLVDALR